METSHYPKNLTKLYGPETRKSDSTGIGKPIPPSEADAQTQDTRTGINKGQPRP